MLFEDFGKTELRPRGSLAISGPRELLATRRVWGAFDTDGRLVDETVRPSETSPQYREHPILQSVDPEDVVLVCDEDVVWGGCIWPHYGHFLTEYVARLWPVLPGGDLEGVPVVFPKPLGWARATEWLEAFGARVVELPDQGVVLFTQMWIPESAWQLDAWATPEIRDIHMHARERMELPEAPPSNVLWLSRARLKKRERIPYDESLLEWILAEHVTSISPETLTLTEQIAAIEAACAVAGVVGSAFHTMLMASEPRECLYLCPGRVHSAYIAQSELLGSSAHFAHTLNPVDARQRGFLGGHRILIPEALQALAATVLPSLLDDRRIAAFARPARLWPGGEQVPPTRISTSRWRGSSAIRSHSRRDPSWGRCSRQRDSVAARGSNARSSRRFSRAQ